MIAILGPCVMHIEVVIDVVTGRLLLVVTNFPSLQSPHTYCVWPNKVANKGTMS